MLFEVKKTLYIELDAIISILVYPNATDTAYSKVMLSDGQSFILEKTQHERVLQNCLARVMDGFF